MGDVRTGELGLCECCSLPSPLQGRWDGNVRGCRHPAPSLMSSGDGSTEGRSPGTELGAKCSPAWPFQQQVLGSCFHGRRQSYPFLRAFLCLSQGQTGRSSTGKRGGSDVRVEDGLPSHWQIVLNFRPMKLILCLPDWVARMK